MYMPLPQLPNTANPHTLEKPLRCFVFTEASIAKRVWEFADDEEVCGTLHNLIHGNVWSRLGVGPCEPPGSYAEFFLTVFGMYKTNYGIDPGDGVGRHQLQLHRFSALQKKMEDNHNSFFKAVDPMNALYSRTCSDIYGDLDTVFYDDVFEALDEFSGERAYDLLTPICNLVERVTSSMEAYFMAGLEESDSVPVFMCIQGGAFLVYVP